MEEKVKNSFLVINNGKYSVTTWMVKEDLSMRSTEVDITDENTIKSIDLNAKAMMYNEERFNMIGMKYDLIQIARLLNLDVDTLTVKYIRPIGGYQDEY